MLPPPNFWIVLSLFITCLSRSTVVNAASIPHLDVAHPSIRDVWRFPNGTWVENIAARPNGQLLVTLISSPEIYQVDPFETHKPALIYRFPDVLSALGIAEIGPDVFAVIAGNFSLKTASSTSASYSVWRVDMRGCNSRPDGTIVSPVIVTKITDIPEAQFLNGMTLLDRKTASVLISDSGAGVVWRLDTDTGAHKVVLNDPSMKPEPGAVVAIGINGIHILNSTVYFTNTFKGLFVRVPVDLDGMAAGPYDIVAHNGFGDDFALDNAGNAYVTHDNAIQKITPAGAVTIIAGNLNSSVLAEDTSAAFGRTRADRSILYVATAGGILAPINGTYIEGGKVVALNIAALT
ncbi:hypothetical protein MMC06_000049 [Schaereria dolodes]|nr:hypothetical protein [Schaereria dolodes]